MVVLEVVRSCWFAWTCAGLSSVIAACTVFRSPLGLDALIIRLDSQIIATNAQIIKSQERVIASQQKLINELKRRLMVEGILPWDDDDDP